MKRLMHLMPSVLLLVSLAYSSDQKHQPMKRSRIEPEFEDENRTTIIGSPGKDIVLPCNIFMLQDHTVSWVHRTKNGLDLLTIGNSTYTLEPRISTDFKHPSNWRLKIANLKPNDAGTYICQISTFPPKVKMTFLEIHGPMIEIVRDQVVYNAGSNVEVSCLYRNSTVNHHEKKDALQRMKEMAIIGRKIPPGLITWRHNNKTFSHRNRRRIRTIQKIGYIESTLSIKSAIVQDSGNYSCILQNSPQNFDVVRINVVDGEHSAAIYKNSKNSLLPINSSSLVLEARLFVVLVFIGTIFC